MVQTSEIINVVREASGTIPTTAQTSKVTNVSREASGTIKSTAQKSDVINVVREVSGTIATYGLYWLPQYYSNVIYSQQPPVVGTIPISKIFAPGGISNASTYAVICIN